MAPVGAEKGPEQAFFHSNTVLPRMVAGRRGRFNTDTPTYCG
jgi:hypothetical protein